MAAAVTASATTTNFIVTPELLAHRPVSPLLVGSLLELGYGMQAEGMWSEMFFNRSFEQFPPYKPISTEWSDLWLDPKDPAKGIKTDWSKEQWYHSGYEHNPWFAAPGDCRQVPIDDKSTFMIGTSTAAKVQLRRQSGGSGHGVQQLRVWNHEPKNWAGLGQGGKYLRKGVTYRFRGMLRATDKPVRPEVRFYRENDWSKPLAIVRLDEIGTAWSERIAKIPNPDFEGRATFVLWLPPQSEVAVDDFSLMPVDNINGWRRDIVEPLRRAAPAIIKFPGGCSASFYDWRDGIGERSKRPPQQALFWGGFNYNDVGVAEYANLCREIGVEMLWCVNVYHPKKAEYEWFWGEDGPAPGKHGLNLGKFTDIERGAQEAANLVAYCNRVPGTHPMADLRAKHGYPRPFGIRYWELDNEAYRWFEPQEYARAAVVYAKAMKAVDPRIQVGMGVYGYRLGPDGSQRVVFQDAIPEMLVIAGKDVDFLADRGTADKQYLNRVVGLLDRYNSQNKASVRYADTGKFFYEPQATVAGHPEISSWGKSSMAGTWFYAMKALKDYMVYQRMGGDVDTVVFNDLANAHNQSLINTPKEGVFLSASGVAMSVMAKSPAAWPLRFDGYEAGSADDFQVSASWDKSKSRLVLYLFNRTASKRSATFDYERLDRGFEKAEVTAVWSATPLDKNTMSTPLNVRHETRLEPKTKRDRLHTVVAEPWSFVQAVLE